MRTFILAWNYRAAMECAQSSNLSSWVHLHYPEQLYGYRDGEVWIYDGAPRPWWFSELCIERNMTVVFKLRR